VLFGVMPKKLQKLFHQKPLSQTTNKLNEFFYSVGLPRTTNKNNKLLANFKQQKSKQQQQECNYKVLQRTCKPR